MTDQPVYPDDQSATAVWESEAQRSQRWAEDSRTRAARRIHRQRLAGVVLLGLVLIFICVVVGMLAFGFMQMVQSQR